MRSARGSSVERCFIAPALIMLALGVTVGRSYAADPGAASAPTPASAPQPTAKKAALPAPAVRVDVNSASRAQLKTLPGIGDAEADRIIAGRPYLSKADLASKNAIPTGIYLQIKDRIVAIQKQKPKGIN